MSIWRHSSETPHPAGQHTVPLPHGEPHQPRPAQHTRHAMVWVRNCIAALLLVARSFFIGQNTASVRQQQECRQ